MLRILGLRSTTLARRGLGTTACRANLVQDLYLRELKGTKIAEPKLADAEVKHWRAPAAPQAPAGEVSAEGVAAYAQEPVETVGEQRAEDAGKDEDWLVVE